MHSHVTCAATTHMRSDDEKRETRLCVRSRWSTSGATNGSTMTCTAADWISLSAKLAKLAWLSNVYRSYMYAGRISS